MSVKDVVEIKVRFYCDNYAHCERKRMCKILDVERPLVEGMGFSTKDGRTRYICQYLKIEAE